MVIYIVCSKAIGIHLVILCINIGKSFSNLFVTIQEQRKILNSYYSFNVRHLVEVQLRTIRVANKEHTRIGVIYNVMHIVGFKIVQDGHSYCTVSNNRKERYSPMRAIASTKCNVIAWFNATHLIEQMQFCYLAGYITVCVGDTFVVSKSTMHPILSKAIGIQTYKSLIVRHNIVDC